MTLCERLRILSKPVSFVKFAVEIKGFEPLTPCLQGRCSPN